MLRLEAMKPAVSMRAPAPMVTPFGLIRNTRPLDSSWPRICDCSAVTTRLSTALIAPGLDEARDLVRADRELLPVDDRAGRVGDVQRVARGAEARRAGGDARSGGIGPCGAGERGGDGDRGANAPRSAGRREGCDGALRMVILGSLRPAVLRIEVRRTEERIAFDDGRARDAQRAAPRRPAPTRRC